jgi:carboxypeptidase PM20D1
MKKWLVGIALFLVVVCAVLVLRATRLQSPPPPAVAVDPLPLDENALAQRLAQGLTVATVSDPESAPGAGTKLLQFHQLLRGLYPAVHANLQVETINDYSLLYTWTGSDATLPPVLLAAHMDVVPIEPGTETQWTHPPFAGVIADDYVWGRGALDDKSCLMGLLEAVEHLSAEGFRPRRTIYLAFGHDEEIGGKNGAAQIAATLKDRGVRLAFTLDEGSAIMQGIIAGIEPPVAAIMAGEKGYITFRLSLKGHGGHSSMPGKEMVVPRLARAIARLDEHPLPPHLTPPVATMLERLAPEMPFAARLMIANRELFEPILLKVLSGAPITNALIRSTQAITVFRGGVKDNVLPSEAYALVNYRLLPGDTIAAVRQHIVEAIDDDAVEVAPTEEFGNEAPPLSDPNAPQFDVIARSVAQVFPQALISSGIIMATTDNRHYAAVRDQAYYFAPFFYRPDDQTRIHGTDERIGVAEYADMVRFYRQLIGNTSDMP